MFECTVSDTGDAYCVEYSYAYLAENWVMLSLLNIACINNKWWNQNLENSSMCYKWLKSVCVMVMLMIYIDIMKVQECFKKDFCYKLLYKKILLVAHA